MIATTFFISIFVFLASFLILIYFGYSIFLTRNLSRGLRVKVDPNYFPKVSLVVCAYNEEKTIAKKIENVLQIDYPRDKLEVVVLDNGSEDRTFEIASSFIKRGIKVLRIDNNRGKCAGLNYAFKKVAGNIVFMSDADCYSKIDILRKVVPYFADPTVGAVTASGILVNPEESSATRMENNLQGFYNYIRKAESAIDSTIIFNGDLAFRRESIQALDEDIGADDVQIPIKIRKRGRRTLLLEEANFYETSPSSFKARWRQKVRRSAQIAQALIRYRDTMFKPKYGIYGMLIYPAEFFMHVLSPYITLVTAAIGVFLLYSSFWRMLNIIIYLSLFSLITALIMNVYINRVASGTRSGSLIYTLLTFFNAQLALLVGSLSLLWRKPYTWRPMR